MAGAEELFFVEEKAMVIDELIQISKYCKLQTTISAQPDHDVTGIRPSDLEKFYDKNLDLIEWLKITEHLCNNLLIIILLYFYGPVTSAFYIKVFLNGHGLHSQLNINRCNFIYC